MTLIGRTADRGVTTLTLDSPANRNALSASLVGELRAALAACAADDTVRAVLLTHTGTTFCAGADLKAPPDPEAFVGLMREIVALPRPVGGPGGGAPPAGGGGRRGGGGT
ncbi:enoyl-CoA hydratase-related protein, partial [Streptomyces anulatus]